MEGVVQPVLREIYIRADADCGSSSMPSQMSTYQSLSGLYDGVDVVPVGFHFLRGLEENIAILVRAPLVCRQVDHREVQQVQGLLS